MVNEVSKGYWGLIQKIISKSSVKAFSCKIANHFTVRLARIYAFYSIIKLFYSCKASG